MEGLDGVLDITDDILIYGVGNTEDEANADHDQKLLKLLERCQSRGIALNPDKLKLRRKSVTFMGHVLSNEASRLILKRPRLQWICQDLLMWKEYSG